MEVENEKTGPSQDKGGLW